MNIKEMLKKIVFPPVFFVFLLVNISVAGLIFVFTQGMERELLAYIMYTLSSYMLITVCVRVPGIVKRVKDALHENKYTDMYLTDKELRMRISLYQGLLVTFLFAAYKIILGFLYNSSWFFAMAGYNVILSLMRFILIYRSQKKGISAYEERRRGVQGYHVCGWLVMILNIAVSVIMFMVIVQKQFIHYDVIAAIGLATHTFYCFLRSLFNMIKYSGRKNPIFAAVKRIDMVKAIVSVFILQVTMLCTFDTEEKWLDIRQMNMFTGIMVIIAINTIGAIMIAEAKKDLKELEKPEKLC